MSKYVKVNSAYFIDRQIIEKFAEGLVTKDFTLIEEAAAEANDRLNGLCFCSAWSESECVCGAWEK